MEKVFNPHSYGFGRPGRSVYHALREVSRMAGISWIVEGDIELKNFTGFHRQRLAKIFSQYINPDQTLRNFFWKSCKAGCLEPSKFRHAITGVTTGGSFYPLFANLFLTPFDEYTDKLKKEFNRSVSNNSSSFNQRGQQAVKVERKISYVRYGDKFLLGVSGSYKDVVFLRDCLKDFLSKELGLILNNEEIKIIHLGSDYAKFLGYYITVPSYSQCLALNPKGGGAYQDYIPKMEELSLILSTRVPKLMISKKVIKEWLIYKGLADPQGKPKYVGKWIYLSDGEIIHRFNDIIVGLINHYKMGENRKDLNEAVYIIKYSLLHTIAAKHRMRISQVIRKYTIDQVNKKLGVKLENGRWIITFDEPKSLSAVYLDENYSKSPTIDPFF